MENKSATQRGLEEITTDDFLELYLDSKESFLQQYKGNKYISYYNWLFDQYIKVLIENLNSFNSFLEESFPYKREILNENIRLILIKVRTTLSYTIALIEPQLTPNDLQQYNFVLYNWKAQSLSEIKKDYTGKKYLLYDKRHIDNFFSNIFDTLKYFLSFFIDYKAKPKEFEDYVITYFNNEYENDLKEYDNKLQKHQEELREWRKLKLKDKKPKTKKPIKPVKPTHETAILKAILKAKGENRFPAYHELFAEFSDYGETKKGIPYKNKVIGQLRKYRTKINEEAAYPPNKLIEIHIN